MEYTTYEWARFVSLASMQANQTDGNHKHTFVLDTPLCGVDFAEVLSMEIRVRVLTVRPQSQCLYFSEEHEGGKVVSFRAELPPGTYSHESLASALSSAMTSATPVYGQGPPQNTYVLELTEESKKACLCSNGRRPFALHTYSECPTVVSVTPNKDRLLVTFRGVEGRPMARGAAVCLIHPDRGELHTIVTDAAEPFSISVDACGQTDVPSAGWRLEPQSGKRSMHRLLGFPSRDVSQGGTDVFLYGMSNPLTASHRVHLSTVTPHACRKGDQIELLDVQTSWNRGRVVDVPSEQHLVMMPWSLQPLADLEPALHILLSPDDRDPVVLHIKAVDEPIVVEDGRVEMKMHVADVPVSIAAVAGAASSKARLVGPIPCREWSLSPSISIRSVDTDKGIVVVSMRYPDTANLWRRGVSRIRRVPGVVMAEDALVPHHRVLYMRLWLGRTECTSVVRSTGSDTFARARLPPEGSSACLSASDFSVMGMCCLRPPLDKVTHVSVQMMDADGRAVDADWSVFLRVSGRQLRRQ